MRMTRAEVEAAILRIWRDTFDDPSVGVESDFFELGGNSVHATLIAELIRGRCGVDLPFSMFFDRPNPRQMAAAICEGSSVNEY
jgi:hypothetical protein